MIQVLISLTESAYKEMCDRAIAIAQEINNERRREGGQTA